MSLSFSIELTGLQEKIDSLNNLNSTYKQEMEAIAEEHGEQMVRDARTDHEFISRTGTLENSIGYEVDASDILGLEFGLMEHTEYGHIIARDDPFLQNAWEGNIQALQDDLESLLDDKVREAIDG